MKIIKKNKLLFIVVLAYILLLVILPQKSAIAVKNSLYYIKEMMLIMPVIFILTSLIEAWVPRETIIKNFGENSGIKGSLYSFILGSFSAGPIYAAFPICKMLLKKGASISNIVVILSSWAVVKVPMLANEAKFLGVRFMGIRWLLTSTSIFIMAYIMSKLVKKESIPIDINDSTSDMNRLYIDQQYCIGCGICNRLSPEYFELENGKVKLIKHDILDNGINNVIEKCPVRAISIK